MKRIVTSLPFRLLLGVVIGIIAGQLSGTALMNIVVTVKFVLGELINFCVPLIIIGFIAPSITRLGKNASRMLGAAVFLRVPHAVLVCFHPGCMCGHLLQRKELLCLCQRACNYFSR